MGIETDTSLTLDQVVAELGGTQPAETTTDTTVAPAAETTPETTSGSTSTDTPPQTQTQTQPQTEEPKPDRAQQAFANMRVQNKRYSDTLKGVANVLGITPDLAADETKLLAAIQEKITATQAQQQNVPVELLTRMQQIEAQNQEYLTRQRESEVAVGFQRLKDTYNLTQPQLNSFAEDLVKNGINPLEQTTDLVKQYKLLYFDQLVEKAKQEAIAAEQARAAKASNQSTTPGSRQGAGSLGDPAKVNSVHDLNNWFASHNIK